MNKPTVLAFLGMTLAIICSGQLIHASMTPDVTAEPVFTAWRSLSQNEYRLLKDGKVVLTMKKKAVGFVNRNTKT